MVRQHHQLNAHESEETLGDSEGQGSLACCSPWDHKDSDMTVTEQQNLTYFQYTTIKRVPQTVKCLPAMRETWVQSPGREDPLEQMATHSSTLA